MLKTAVIGCLVAVAVWLYMFPRSTTLNPTEMKSKYDYIIVGAGSAGSVLAARLSEDRSKTVLLLEAGPEENALFHTHIPGLVAFLQQTKVDWAYKSEPQQLTSQAMHDKRQAYPRGKLLGGTSILNYMVVNRCDPSDYDRWAKMPGCEGWSYKEMLPYLKRLERVQFKADEFRGQSGQLHIKSSPMCPLADALIEVAHKMGHKTNKDLNSPEHHQDEFHRAQNNIDSNGKRESTAKKYLRPVMGRENLDVIANAHATKIIFTSDKRASGVQFLWHDGSVHEAHAQREVIVAAGAIASPQLLQLSGIGATALLKKHKISMVADLPGVGENLVDHPAVWLMYAINDSDAILNHDRGLAPARVVKAIWDYLMHGTGPFSFPGLSALYHETSGLRPGYKSDLQITLIIDDLFMGGKTTWLQNIKEETLAPSYATAKGRGVITVPITLHHPKSRGHVRIRSVDPFEHPVIQPNLLAEQIDHDMYLNGLHRLHEFMSAPGVADRFGIELIHECEGLKKATDKHFKCIYRNFGANLYHPMGTCAMGAQPDNGAVVDNRLRVHKVRGLRVVDASIFPDTVGCNTNIPTIATAEKAADIIKEDNKN